MKKAKKIIIISLSLLLTTIIIFFVGFDGILKFIVRNQTSLRNRNMMRRFYLKLPITLDFKVYFFNISNPSEVEQGENPVVKEIGPYWYDSYKEKIDVIDNEGEDSLTYTPYETYFFNQEKSKHLREDDYVTILNPVIVGAVNYVLQDWAPLFPILVKAFKLLLNDPKSIYFTVKVRKILFDGILVNCTHKDYVAKAICPQIRTMLSNILFEPQKNIFLISLMGRRNGTLPQRLKVLRGIKNPKKLGRVVELDDKKHLSIWSTKTCNRFRGTDGWIFPPFLTKEEGIWIFPADICRNIQAKFDEDFTYRGIAVRRYRVSLGDMSRNPEDKCYCPSFTSCLPKGVFDLSKCLGVPSLYITLPHMLEVEPAVRRRIKGMRPNRDKHDIFLIFEYRLGVPLVAAKRVQFNLPLKSVSKISFMKTLPDVLHPLVWIEESAKLSGNLFNAVYAFNLLLKMMAIVRFFFLGLSLAGFGYGLYLYFKNKKVAPLQGLEPSSRSDGDLIPKNGSFGSDHSLEEISK